MELITWASELLSAHITIDEYSSNVYFYLWWTQNFAEESTCLFDVFDFRIHSFFVLFVYFLRKYRGKNVSVTRVTCYGAR